MNIEKSARVLSKTSLQDLSSNYLWKSSSDKTVDSIDEAIRFLAGSRNIPFVEGEVEEKCYEESFFDSYQIPDFNEAIEKVFKAKEEKTRVAIFGDYDVDGITSSAILAEALEKLGIKFEVFLPHREDDGYGLNDSVIKKISKTADLLIAIDNGTSAHKEIELAKKLGLEVIVIDHHEVKETLPEALVVNPHREDSKYPFKELCAAGLAFKFARAICAKLGREDDAKWLLDLAALGTVADRVTLTGENRAIVYYGLKVLAVTKRKGLISLILRSGLFAKKIDAETLAFKIIPRLNAAGRMQHADLAFDLITTKDNLEAEKLSAQLDALNNDRKKITESAVREIKEDLLRTMPLPEVICAGGNWPVGILGILAGKIADDLRRPTAVVNLSERICTGSIRGNGGDSVVDILASFSHVFSKFGGHHEAGGFSFAMEDYPLVENFFRDVRLSKSAVVPAIYYDFEISPKIINNDFISLINKLEPYGEGNVRPIFLLRNFLVDDLRALGTEKNHRRFVLSHNDLASQVSAVAFHWNARQLPNIRSRVDLLAELRLNDFRGNVSVDLHVKDMRTSENI
jgi:single-stranded-DNA-specific exonuclease